MPRKPKVNTQKLISLIQENKNTYEIAQELNVTPPTVKYWIKKLSLEKETKIKPFDVWRCPICGELLWGHNPEIHMQFVHKSTGG